MDEILLFSLLEVPIDLDTNNVINKNQSIFYIKLIFQLIHKK